MTFQGDPFDDRDLLDWYDKRDELEPEQVFLTQHGDKVKLDRRIPGDGTDWYAAIWENGAWRYDDRRLHPSDLKELIET